MSNGLAFSKRGSDMRDRDWAYDSNKRKWTVDPRPVPKHVDVIELNGGTRFTLTRGASQYQEEVLLQLEHKMPFPPEFWAYFYTIDAPADPVLPLTANIGMYTINHAFMLYNAASIGEEGLYFQVDEKYFYVKHFAETFTGGSGAYTFFGNLYKFRLRYLLLNQPALYLGDKGYT